MDFQKLKNINTFIFDVDGVLTTGSIIALDSGEQARNFYVKDGYAIKKAIQQGFNVCIISGGFQEGTRKRLEMLDIKDIFLGVKNKVEVFDKYLTDNDISSENVIYMGDDVPDYSVMKKSGISTCPKDACIDILNMSDYISSFDGGRGCVRDIIEKTMRLQDKWPTFDNCTQSN